MNIKKKLLVIATFIILVVAISTVASAAVLGERILQAGYFGEDVMVLQTKLNAMGFTTGSDGIYGPQTVQAVMNLQKTHELAVDGIAGQETFRFLSGSEFVQTSRGRSSNEPGRYKKVLDIIATAYAPGPHDNGKWGSLTHVGTHVRPGIIAVDPSIIPLGSRVYIQYPDGHGVYATAEDTGGAIKGNRIDVAMWSVAEANDFGMQNVKVYVMN